MTLETDFIVVGSGIAGLRAAVELAGRGARVTVLTKDRREESNTEYAQGGVAVALSEEDEVSLHEEDTRTVHGAARAEKRAVENRDRRVDVELVVAHDRHEREREREEHGRDQERPSRPELGP